jgi:hypothetical protein
MHCPTGVTDSPKSGHPAVEEQQCQDYTHVRNFSGVESTLLKMIKCFKE